MKIFSLNSTNNGASIIGHILSENSGVGFITGLNSVNSNQNPSSYNSESSSINTITPLSQVSPTSSQQSNNIAAAILFDC